MPVMGELRLKLGKPHKIESLVAAKPVFKDN